MRGRHGTFIYFFSLFFIQVCVFSFVLVVFYMIAFLSSYIEHFISLIFIILFKNVNIKFFFLKIMLQRNSESLLRELRGGVSHVRGRHGTCIYIFSFIQQ